jgi:hypothetical protein
MYQTKGIHPIQVLAKMFGSELISIKQSICWLTEITSLSSSFLIESLMLPYYP